MSTDPMAYWPAPGFEYRPEGGQVRIRQYDATSDNFVERLMLLDRFKTLFPTLPTEETTS